MRGAGGAWFFYAFANIHTVLWASWIELKFVFLPYKLIVCSF